MKVQRRSKMNLQKRCRKCRAFFPAKPMEPKFFCDKKECQEYLTEYHFYTLKSNRYIPMDYFDIYDLDRPILTDGGKIFEYERVCRQCGEPLFNKNGKYSYHRRYCGNHTGYELWVKYNWAEVSKKYARKVSKENKELISKQFIEKLQDLAIKSYYKENPEGIKRDLRNLTICEECKKICSIYTGYGRSHSLLKLEVVNIHHKIPVHTLTGENLRLIWDYSNLKALCEDCHHKQDHQLKTDPYVNFKKITNFI